MTSDFGVVGVIGVGVTAGVTSEFGVAVVGATGLCVPAGFFCSGGIVTTACATEEVDGLGVGAADMRRPFISTGFLIRDENREIPFAKQHQSSSLA